MPPYNSPTSLAHPYTTNPYAATGHNPFVDPYQGSNSVARRSAYSPYPVALRYTYFRFTSFVARVLVDNISFCPLFSPQQLVITCPESRRRWARTQLASERRFPILVRRWEARLESSPPLPSPTSSFDGSNGEIAFRHFPTDTDSLPSTPPPQPPLRPESEIAIRTCNRSIWTPWENARARFIFADSISFFFLCEGLLRGEDALDDIGRR